MQLIEELGDSNVLWSAAQLDSMTPQTFDEAAETLGSVTGYSQEQLTALRDKTLEVRPSSKDPLSSVFYWPRTT